MASFFRAVCRSAGRLGLCSEPAAKEVVRNGVKYTVRKVDSAKAAEIATKNFNQQTQQATRQRLESESKQKGTES